MNIATQRFFRRWWIIFVIIPLALLFQQSGPAKPLLALGLFVGVIWFLVRDYKQLQKEHRPRGNDKKRVDKNPFTPATMQRLRQMQKLGLSLEAMALHAGTSPEKVAERLRPKQTNQAE